MPITELQRPAVGRAASHQAFNPAGMGHSSGQQRQLLTARRDSARRSVPSRGAAAPSPTPPRRRWAPSAGCEAEPLPLPGGGVPGGPGGGAVGGAECRAGPGRAERRRRPGGAALGQRRGGAEPERGPRRGMQVGSERRSERGGAAAERGRRQRAAGGRRRRGTGDAEPRPGAAARWDPESRGRARLHAGGPGPRRAACRGPGGSSGVGEVLAAVGSVSLVWGAGSAVPPPRLRAHLGSTGVTCR